MSNRYANDWNSYSDGWDRRYGSRYQHLGDEWCDDGSAERRGEERLFAHAAEPWLTAQTRLLEIGCGGGKWTVRLAPRVGSLTVLDVAEAMIARTRRRCEDVGLANVTFVHGNGRDLMPVGDATQDVVWSYDVFVHIAFEDTVGYLLDVARVLRPGGLAVIHHAVNDTPNAWDRIESHNDWYRAGNTLGQYYYHSRDALDRMYARAGLQIKTMWSDFCTVVVTAQRPYDSVAPDLERALRLMATATDDASLVNAVTAVEGIGQRMQEQLALLAADARHSRRGQERYAAVQRIRQLLRS